jgi:hypothetical protein
MICASRNRASGVCFAHQRRGPTDHGLSEKLSRYPRADKSRERFPFGQKVTRKDEQISNPDNRENDSQRCDLKHPKWCETSASHNAIDKQIRRGADKCDHATEDREIRKRN